MATVLGSEPMEPFEPFAHLNANYTTTFGNDLFESLPAGQTAVIVSQPAHGTVEITNGSGWQLFAAPIPAMANGPVPDSWSWQPSGGGDVVVVPLQYQNLDAE